MLHEIQESRLLPERPFQAGLLDSTYENVLEHMDSGVMLFDEEGFLTFLNARAYGMLELQRYELSGCTIVDLLTHLSLARTKKRQLLKVYRETVYKGKSMCELMDEYGRYWEVNASYGADMNGSYLFTIKEVSDYKRIEQTAYQNDNLAMLGKLSASIAHEIRNPLTAIRGFIQLLRPHLQGLGKEEYAKIILAEIDRANDIIHEFLSSSKPSSPQTRIASISALLKEVILLTESEVLMKGCQIDLQSLASDLYVSVDVKQMKQVLINMIRNALEAVSDRLDDSTGRIELGARKEGSEVRILISDNGKGMDACTMNRLFSQFFTTKENGTGLGLSVSDRIVKNHGGRISVTSRVNEGTSFVISLPLITGFTA
ncbi:ATP-binding protein [Paenibacillus sp. URB8-2]|uniref:ATP-binding protein n=1 Tax=Paenibacillus sp. URB8-2 TaxID=2741301 RepID=UPI0015BD1FB7|nr:ATP-binding protein [Paenibacillus sp. URB8-2]BCG57965.1 hypothetical protein PUR_13900 [Paenibacillus sp. URB8-2]